MLFWGLVAVLAIGSGGLLGLTLLRRQSAPMSSAQYDLQVYRDQLSEIDRDVARGILTSEDAARTRVEISRRILVADAQLEKDANAPSDTSQNTSPAAWAIGGGAALLIAAAAVLLYQTIGVPGYTDMPLAKRYAASEAARNNRRSQTEVEATLPAPQPNADIPADFLQLMERLRTTVAERPDDLQGQMLLARNEVTVGDFRAAHAAQEAVIRLKASAATDEDYAIYADMLITAAQGYVSKDADLALRQALERNPQNKRALYYIGLYFMQIGRPDRTFRVWRDVLNSSQPDDPWVPHIRQELENVAQLAGEKYTPPAAAMPGPDADAIAAASEMNAEDRQAMIRTMVTRLAERLGTEGGTPEEWARLIGAYGVLGETDKARAVWTEAQSVFASKPDALATVRAGAQQAGVAE